MVLTLEMTRYVPTLPVWVKVNGKILKTPEKNSKIIAQEMTV